MLVNGKEMSFEGEITIDELLFTLSLNKNKVVLEINLEIISRDKYSTYILNDKDKIEIISLIGGG